MKSQWLDYCLKSAATPAAFYSGCRKIHRAQTFTLRKLKDDLAIGDIGFTKSKITILTKSYVHEESRKVAVELWNVRVERAKYGSVGFHCFSHYVKGVAENHYWERINGRRPGSKRSSMMGPCIQSVSITLGAKNKTTIDIFYRTTELFKKFPADLIFVRDVLLSPFDFSKAPIERVNFHFANVTCHPQYFVTLIPFLGDSALEELDELKRRDPHFFNWTMKWTARYVCPEHHRGIAKFEQALRVQMAAKALIPPDLMEKLIVYVRANHPGHKGGYVDPDEDAEE